MKRRDVQDYDTRLEEFPWATFFAVITSLLVILGGAIAVIFTDDYGFAHWLDTLAVLTIGLGLLAIGRGVRIGLMKQRTVV